MDNLEFVCRELGVDKELIWSASKTRDVVALRRVVICFLYNLGLNYNQIGRKVNRDHQVVIYSLEKATQDIKYLAEKLVAKYEAKIMPPRPTIKVPNYKNSSIEVRYVD